MTLGQLTAADLRQGDALLECADCGLAFVFTAGERVFFEDRDFSPPKRCKPCRESRKLTRGD